MNKPECRGVQRTPNNEAHSPNFQRKSIRLKEYDYSKEGAYFITICTSNQINYFEFYPELKKIVTNEWWKLTDQYNCITLDEFVVMPNHMHGIIFMVKIFKKR